jgi:L-fuconolactonase
MSSAPAIDAHAHLVDPARRSDPDVAARLGGLDDGFGPDQLSSVLAEEGFDGTILVQLTPSTAETVDLLAAAADSAIVLGVVGWVDLTAPGVGAAIEALRGAPGGERLVGLRHRVHAEPDADWLGRLDVRRGLAAAADAGLVFDLSVRTRELPAAVDVARALPALRLVLDHLARPPIASGDITQWARALLALAEQPGVSATISGLVGLAAPRTWSIDDLRHPVELALDAFGPERLMVGSDWPLCLSAGTYGDAIDTVRFLLADLSAHEQADILGGTAVRVYRLDRIGSSVPPAPAPGTP